MSWRSKARELRQVDGSPVSSRGLAGDGRLAEMVARALHDEFGTVSSRIKVVARLTGSSERTVKNWFEARNGPSGEHLVRLMQRSDHVMRAVLSYAGRSDLLANLAISSARSVMADAVDALDALAIGHDDRRAR